MAQEAQRGFDLVNASMALVATQRNAEDQRVADFAAKVKAELENQYNLNGTVAKNAETLFQEAIRQGQIVATLQQQLTETQQALKSTQQKFQQTRQ